MKLVTVEFTRDTEKRSKGDRVRVDFASAESFVKKGVAKMADQPDPPKAPEPVGDDD